MTIPAQARLWWMGKWFWSMHVSNSLFGLCSPSCIGLASSIPSLPPFMHYLFLLLNPLLLSQQTYGIISFLLRGDSRSCSLLLWPEKALLPCSSQPQASLLLWAKIMRCLELSPDPNTLRWTTTVNTSEKASLLLLFFGSCAVCRHGKGQNTPSISISVYTQPQRHTFYFHPNFTVSKCLSILYGSTLLPESQHEKGNSQPVHWQAL